MSFSSGMRDHIQSWRPPRPLPGLAASATQHVPRWVFFLLGIFYLWSGLFTHGPWQGPDLLGMAQARAILQVLQPLDASVVSLGDTVGSLLFSQLQGGALLSDGPLTAWWMALGMAAWALLAGSLAGFPVSIESLHAAGRISLVVWILAGLVCLWQATHRLSRRREARPDDPLGIGPTAPAFATTMADCAVLLALACIGAFARWHEASTHALHFCLTAGLLWAMAVAPERPRQAGLWIGALTALGFFNEGLRFLLAALAGITMACLFVAPWRLIAPTLVRFGLPVLFLGPGLWLMAVIAFDQEALLKTWWDSQQTAIPRSLLHGPETWAWSWWPLWPMVLTLMVQAWRHGLWRLFHLQMVAALLLPWILVYGLGLGGANPARFMPVALLACLAAYGLLSLPRSVTSLVDWFAVVAFTGLGVLIWLYWSAIVFGFPEHLASRLDFLAPGVTGDASLFEFLAGVSVSGLWIALITWRIGRGENRLWRPVVLSAGGVSLAWVLMMNLLLPALEINRGYGHAVAGLQSAIDRATPLAGLTPAQTCVQAPGTDLISRAIVLSSLTLPLARPSYGQCHWRLSTSSFVPEGWATVLVIPRNPNRPERTRFYLQERIKSE